MILKTRPNGWTSRYTEHRPSRDLESLVECFWKQEVTCLPDCPDPTPLRILPDGCIDFVFRFDQNMPPENGQVVGAMTRPLLVSIQQSVTFWGVRFHPGGAADFLAGMPACELTDASASTSEVLKIKRASRHDARMSAATSSSAQVARLESLLRSQLARRTKPASAWLAPAVAQLRAQAGNVRIDALCRHYGLTRQHLTRVFQAKIGLSPKQLARVFRLRRVLAQVRHRQGARREISWSSLAFEFGYCDQAHLNSEFHALTGLTPGQHLAELSAASDGSNQTPES